MSTPTDAQANDTTPNSANGDPREPPATFAATVRNLGPGAIIAASAVGSSVFFAMAQLGAEAGFWLLWLVLLGCVCKVFIQVELGRYTLVNGATTLAALNEVPGPRLRVRWTLWFWLAMFVGSLGQLAGILGGVGQCLALTFPLTGDFAERVEIGRQQAKFDRGLYELDQRRFIVGESLAGPTASELQAAYRALGTRPVVPEQIAYTRDDVIWATVVTLLTLLLLRNSYRVIARLCLALVCAITLLAVVNLCVLQFDEQRAITAADLGKGFRFQLPPIGDALAGRSLLTALAAFGIVGIGAAELICYPYWCLEMGYARHIGTRDVSDAWARRAQGWLRVMRWDAFASLLLYTIAAVAFYLLGAAVLHRQGINSAGYQLIDSLATALQNSPILGTLCRVIFLSGAVLMLYAALFAMAASNARVASDAVDWFRGTRREERAFGRRIKRFSFVFPLVAFGIYLASKDPIKLLLLGGILQAIMLPLLAVSAVFVRYRRCDARLAPSRVWDIALWCSLLALVASGAALAFLLGAKLVDQIVTTINW